MHSQCVHPVVVDQTVLSKTEEAHMAAASARENPPALKVYARAQSTDRNGGLTVSCADEQVLGG